MRIKYNKELEKFYIDVNLRNDLDELQTITHCLNQLFRLCVALETGTMEKIELERVWSTGVVMKLRDML